MIKALIETIVDAEIAAKLKHNDDYMDIAVSHACYPEIYEWCATQGVTDYKEVNAFTNFVKIYAPDFIFTPSKIKAVAKGSRGLYFVSNDIFSKMIAKASDMPLLVSKITNTIITRSKKLK